MDLPIKEIIGASVTLTVGLLGFLQWRKTKRSGKFLEDRENAYKEVWATLEDVHLQVRAEAFATTQFNESVKSANVLLIKNGLHVEAEDRALAADYMRDLKILGVMLSKLAPDHPGKQDLIITAEQPAIPDEFMPAFQQMTETRNQLVKSFRKALGDGQI